MFNGKPEDKKISNGADLYITSKSFLHKKQEYQTSFNEIRPKTYGKISSSNFGFKNKSALFKNSDSPNFLASPFSEKNLFSNNNLFEINGNEFFLNCLTFGENFVFYYKNKIYRNEGSCQRPKQSYDFKSTKRIFKKV